MHGRLFEGAINQVIKHVVREGVYSRVIVPLHLHAVLSLPQVLLYNGQLDIIVGVPLTESYLRVTAFCNLARIVMRPSVESCFNPGYIIIDVLT